ncbi:MAG TPA: DUF1697 domain-containing protein [Longimicrobiales bacterium]|nr:DUF1697 domain-containing protein [Longimicrobiales bacterium]
MPRYAAFLRGVSPMNAKMAELKRAFELAGFTDVRTVLSSGNVVFDVRAASEDTLVGKAETAMEEHLGRSFATIVRPLDALHEMLATDPYAPFDVDPNAKRVVTFLREKPAKTVSLPAERDGARILCVHGREAFTAYVRSPKGPVFMALIEETFGKDVTTRTWDSVAKVAKQIPEHPK